MGFPEHTGTIRRQVRQLETTSHYTLHVLSAAVYVIAPTRRNSPSQSYLSPENLNQLIKKITREGNGNPMI